LVAGKHQISNFQAICEAPENHLNQNFKIIEIEGHSLFSCNKMASLCHCVARDFKMTKGIAIIFKNKFKRVSDLVMQNKNVGEVAILKENGRFIFYLITKEHSTKICKPTIANLTSAIKDLKQKCIELNVKNLAMPCIACGLDGLMWQHVKKIIVEIFRDSEITITVYKL
jgi:O-acetyl-ADP-ribose deacetylase (regulator of RNase III)